MGKTFHQRSQNLFHMLSSKCFRIKPEDSNLCPELTTPTDLSSLLKKSHPDGILAAKALATYQAATAETDEERNNLNLFFSTLFLEKHFSW